LFHKIASGCCIDSQENNLMADIAAAAAADAAAEKQLDMERMPVAADSLICTVSAVPADTG
jgi:hypothetical protein